MPPQRYSGVQFRQVAPVACDRLIMEAATPLPFSQVRTQGGRLWVDGLVVDDESAVRLAREREAHGEDVARLVLDAIAIGARVLDREQTGANADFVKAEFEKAARELDTAFVERARLVAERLDKRIDDVFGPENGHVTKALERHFGDESSVAVQNRVKALLGEVGVQMREDLRKQFSSAGDNNPLATFQRMAIGAMRDNAQAQSQQLKAMDEKLATLREEVVSSRPRRKARGGRRRGAARHGQGPQYEEEVAAADGRARAGPGRRLRGRRRRQGGHRQGGRRRRHIGASHGPPQRPDRLRGQEQPALAARGGAQLDDALRERNADYAVLVVPSDEKVPSRMHALREYNGDKLIVAYDADEGPLALRSPTRWRAPACSCRGATPRASTALR